MKKMMVIGLIGALVIIAAGTGCSKQNEDVLKDKSSRSGSDTSNVSYAKNIAPLLATNCYECHGNGSSAGSGGIVLEGYTNLLPWVMNGQFVGCVTHAAGFVPMPYLEPALPSAEMNTIVAWVHQGAKNN